MLDRAVKVVTDDKGRDTIRRRAERHFTPPPSVMPRLVT
jgi:hypothetical protein